MVLALARRLDGYRRGLPQYLNLFLNGETHLSLGSTPRLNDPKMIVD